MAGAGDRPWAPQRPGEPPPLGRRHGLYRESVTGPPGFEPAPVGKRAVACQHRRPSLSPEGTAGWPRRIEDRNRGGYVVVPQREVPRRSLRVWVAEEVAIELERGAPGSWSPSERARCGLLDQSPFQSVAGRTRGGCPPLKSTILPVEPVSLARAAIASATSELSRIGGRCPSSSGVISARFRRDEGVSTQSGQTQCTRIPHLEWRGTNEEVSRTRPALAAAYSGEECGPQPSPATDPTLIITPPPRSIIIGIASWVASMGPVRFKEILLSQCAAGASGKYGRGAPPALFTRMPKGVPLSRIPEKSPRTCASLVRSVWTNSESS